MREEYTGQEVSVEAIRPAIDVLGSAARQLVHDNDERISWEAFSELLDAIGEQAGGDPRALGARALASRSYKFRRRLRFVTRMLTLEDLLRFVLYPRNPIDFACINTAVTSAPGEVHVVAYLHDRYRPNAAFFEVLLGAATQLLEMLELPGGRVAMTVSGGQAHFEFTYNQEESFANRVRDLCSPLISGILLRFIVFRSYPDLVAGRKMFEDQLIERAKAEAQLNAAEKAFESRIAQVDEIIAEFDDQGLLVYASPNLESLTGLAPTAGADEFTKLLHTEDLERVKAAFGNALLHGQPERVDDFRVVDAEGHTRWVEIDFRRSEGPDRLSRTIAIGRDITERRQHYEERKELDRQLEQTQRLEVLGVMAGGIAHDFNNLLSPIIGQAELASMDLAENSELYKRVATIRVGAEKAVDLIRQLMTYAGGKTSTIAPVDLGEETEHLLRLAETSISLNVALVVDLADDAVVMGDAAQLRQVIMNLIVNAAESIGDGPGLIELSLRKRDGDVTLTVEDNGCGMDEETRQRAFEPFYSTKFTGRGLGLSAVMGIVRAHGGELKVESDPGKGSRFEMRLSAAGEIVTGGAEQESFANEFCGKVLLVDDEAAVLDVGRELLMHFGFEVECARDGREALEKFDRNNFDVLIVDLVMPRVDGRQVLAAVRQKAPHLPVLVVSGYRPSPQVAEFKTDPYTRFLSKPYRALELGRTLQDLCQHAEDTASAQSVG